MPPSVAPVASTFLERLLFDTDPIEAIGTLSSIWSLRARPEVALFGLSEPEYLVQLCLIYTGELSNGGHSQFFLNRGGRYVLDTLKALRAAGIGDLANILQQATEIFSDRIAPSEPIDAEAAFAAFSEDQWRALGEWDAQGLRLLPSVDALLLAYVQTNHRQVLLPETPLEVRVGRSAV